MSKNSNTPLPLTPNTVDLTYINLEEVKKQHTAETEAGDFNMGVYATLDVKNPKEINYNPTYANLPEKQEVKSFLVKYKWKIVISGAVIVIMMAQCVINGLASGGVFQGKTEEDIVTTRKEGSTLTTINQKLSNLTENIILWKADILDNLKILAINECSSDPCKNGGNCVNRLNGYQCTCLPGYKGAECDVANCKEQLISGDIYSVGDASITASGYYSTAHVPSRGRLDSQKESGLASCWAPAGGSTDRWIQADLGELMLVTGVLTRGRTDGAYIQWVTSYKFLYGETESSLEEYREILPGNENRYTHATNLIEPPVLARFVRINPQTWHGACCMTFDVLGCPDQAGTM
ncbi:unnamed protein product [Owenia fusiformis]|uniref:Uncharacterized protein n=1 Tax=Owenia fusiformis TaxID=6347 RepID=A0A8S4PG66_OWEFU|nr:unnamed protein product [Owenia fusiformis]